MSSYATQTAPPPDEAAPRRPAATRKPRKWNESGLWAVAGRIFGAALAVATHALLTRLLSPAEYGRYVLILSAVTFLGGIIRFGLDRALVRYIAEGFAIGDRDRVRKTILLGLTTLVVSTAACALLTPPILLVVGQYFPAIPSTTSAIAVIITGAALASALQFIAEVFRGMHDQKNAALFDAQASKPLANGLYLAAVAIAGYFLALSASGAMALQVLVLAGLCIAGAIQLRRAMPQVDDLEPSGEHALSPLTKAAFMATCIPLLFTEIISFCSTQGDVWIVGAMLGEQDVALFGAARRFVLAVSMPLMAINLIILPSIPKLYVKRQTAELERLLQKNAVVASIPSLLALLVIVLIPGSLLAIMYGPDYSAAAVCLVTLALAHAVHLLTGSCGQLLMLTGRERVVLVIEIAAAIALFVIGPFVARSYGLNGFVIVTASVLIVKKFVLLFSARALLGVWTHASPARLVDAWDEARQMLTRKPQLSAAIAQVEPRS